MLLHTLSNNYQPLYLFGMGHAQTILLTPGQMWLSALLALASAGPAGGVLAGQSVR